ncbi:MAG TPA: regulatory signaling modulator protein AmpE [Xylella taiwanensis]
MFMTLIAVIVALTLGHLFPAQVATLRSFGWFGRWLAWIGRLAQMRDLWQTSYGLGLALGPLLLAVALLQWCLDGVWHGLFSLLFGVAVVIWTWGPRDLDRDVEAVIDADDASARHLAVRQLQAAGGSLHDDIPSLVEAVVVNALRRWLALLFWFLLLGPFGAVLYRLTALAVESRLSAHLPPANRRGASRFLLMMEWPVAQLMTLSMALVGNFDTVFRAWREAGGNRLNSELAFLGYVARASVRGELREEAIDYTESGLVSVWRHLPELRDAMNLVWRVLLLWIALLVLLIIVSWLT